MKSCAASWSIILSFVSYLEFFFVGGSFSSIFLHFSFFILFFPFRKLFA